MEGANKAIASNKNLRDAARKSLAAVSSNNVVYFSARTNYIDDIVNDYVTNHGFK